MRRVAFAIVLFFAVGASAADIVVSFSILESIVRNLAPPELEIATLVPAGGDAHTHEARAADLKQLKKARTIFAVGSGFEPWLSATLKAADAKARPVFMSDHVSLRGFAGGKDPHFWHDPRKVIAAADAIADRLKSEFPALKDSTAKRAEAFKARLRQLHEDLAAGFAAIPQENRVVVTSHDAFGDFAQAYGLTILSVQGWSTEAEPTAKSVANLIRRIRAVKARALFVENMGNRKTLEQIARETGVKIGGTLYADSLSGAEGPAADYESLMRGNAENVQRVLRR